MAVLNHSAGYLTLINTFTVEPERADELLALLSKATQTIRRMQAFVSANLHVSLDGRRVANYAQWQSREDFDAMLNNPEAQPCLREAAAIGLSFMPIRASRDSRRRSRGMNAYWIGISSRRHVRLTVRGSLSRRQDDQDTPLRRLRYQSSSDATRRHQIIFP